MVIMAKIKKADFGDRSYYFSYGSGIVGSIGRLLNSLDLDSSKVIVVSHPELRDLYAAKLEASLGKAGRSVHWILVPSGEKNKTLASVAKLYSEFASQEVSKRTPVIALGGGVMQDLVNFACATFLRGVPFIQVPTTLLSQADIGIGGCAIDHPKGKSLVGTFYQPKAAVLDTDFLGSLPLNEIRSGISEIINKVVCLKGERPSELRKALPKLLTRDPKTTSRYILKSNATKLAIIRGDETGIRGKRVALDFGHTLTYAIEKATDYKMPHGFALGIGMRAALLLSEEKAGFPPAITKEIVALIEAAGLPICMPAELKPQTLLSLMHVDQKVKDGMVRFVLLSKIGKFFVSEGVSDEELFKLIGKMYE